VHRSSFPKARISIGWLQSQLLLQIRGFMIPEAEAKLQKEVRDVTLLVGKSHTSTVFDASW
jgi:hypothetical protein